jgi:hypothetical protein
MTMELKMIAIGVAVILLALSGFLGYRMAFNTGVMAGKAETQILWDNDKSKIQAIADAAIIEATKDKEAAIANNEGITNDLQTQLDSMRGLNASIAQRLRNSTASAAAHSGTVSQAADNSKPPAAATNDSVGRLNNALAATLTECRTNWASYKALIAEISAQL